MSCKITNYQYSVTLMLSRNTLRNIFAALLAAVAFSAAAELPAPVAARLAAAGVPEDALAVLVRRASDGKVILSHGAERAMQPASTMKLVTSLVALETLGPAYRGRSQLITAGTVAGGVLAGDLVLRGEGDVDLDWQAFQRMLRVARLSGIREIRGDLVIDRSAFTPARTDVGLPPFDETPEFRYNVVPDALLLNTNLVQLDIVSGEREVRVAMTPALAGVTVAADFELVERACEDWEDGWIFPDVKAARAGTIRVTLRGSFPRDCAASTAVNLLDRAVFADRLFRAEWDRLGGKFRGRTREGASPAATRVVAEHRSRPLGEVVMDVNKRSDNPITRMVYLALGVNAGAGGASTASASEREVRAWMARKGIDSDGLVLENGSGLSRTERIRPAQLAAVLEAALASAWAPEFLASLPIVAVDGGMRARLRGTPAEGARIKTGTLRDVSAVAGYVKDDAGDTYIVVAMVNHERAVKQVARPILDALLEWVVSPREVASGAR
jgi:D-alanyl-D-alanine carboxypeptidase/D-alanyl-D-alanine-endopeptidase (penicillin-binding protein 4)